MINLKTFPSLYRRQLGLALNKRRNKSKSKKKLANRRQNTLSWRKKLAFSILTLALFCGIVELSLLLAGVQPLARRTDPYVGFSNQLPLFTERESDGRIVVETASNKLQFFNHQSFDKRKNSNAYRIFCLGGSTTYGRPYNDATSFAGWLRELLPAAAPERDWEVINAGGISYASYRVVRVMEELANYAPDLFIVYTGHNEFLEERTYRDLRKTPGLVREVGGLFARTRAYSAVHRLLRSDAQVDDVTNDQSEAALEAEVATRLDQGVGPDAYERDLLLADRVVEHFEFHLKRMIEIAKEADAEIVFVSPASNLANCSPFKSQFADGFDQREQWQQAYDEAKHAFEQQQFQQARKAIEDAVQIAPEHADTQYLYGRILRQLSNYEAAGGAFTKARELDVCPLRALNSISQRVRKVCSETETPLVDFEKTVEARSPNGIPDESLFLDHVHPTIEGHRILAIELFRWMANTGKVAEPPDWDRRVDLVARQMESRIDRDAHGEALLNLSKVLNWAGKHEDAHRLALQANQLTKNDPESIYLAGNALLKERKIDAAITKFREALQIDPDFELALNSLGTAQIQRGNLDEAVETFRRVVHLKPEFAPAHNNLGTLYQKRREFDLAMKHFNEAIRLNPRYSKAYNNAAVLLRSQNKFREAESYLRKALSINPNFAEAHFNLGKTFELQGAMNSSEPAYRQALRLNPNYVPAIVGLGNVLEKQKRWEAASTFYKNAMRSPSPNLEIGRRLAWLMATCPDAKFRNGRAAFNLAKQCAEATNYQQASMLSALAAAHAELGEFQPAVKWQSQAIVKSRANSRDIHRSRLELLKRNQPIRME